MLEHIQTPQSQRLTGSVPASCSNVCTEHPAIICVAPGIMDEHLIMSVILGRLHLRLPLKTLHHGTMFTHPPRDYS